MIIMGVLIMGPLWLFEGLWAKWTDDE